PYKGYRGFESLSLRHSSKSLELMRSVNCLVRSLPSGFDAACAYIVAAWPVLDSCARYPYYAEGIGDAQLTELTSALSEGGGEAMKEGNPQLILQHGEPGRIAAGFLQGTADDNVPLS
ncbi:MAG: hypothetical protein ACREQW_26055, partial [Candidatus Binatia bacterium]